MCGAWLTGKCAHCDHVIGIQCMYQAQRESQIQDINQVL